MPRTTLDLDPRVLADLRRRGRSEGKSLGRVASELLARALSDAEVHAPPPPLRWAADDLGAPRVELEDREAVQAALDGPR